MNTSRGIFDTFPGQPAGLGPFTVVPEPAEVATSPFGQLVRADSPFAMAEDSNGMNPLEPGKSARVPDKRRQGDTPFQVTDAKEGFGFEAVPPAFGASPFEIAPPASPFVIATQPAPAASPFSYEPAPVPAALATFGGWPQPAAPSTPVPVAQPVVAQPPQPQPPPTPVLAPQVQVQQQMVSPESDSFSIRQLELRAIFGVDREMSPDEIFQRARAMPGIRHIARVGTQDIAAIEAIKHVLSNLGFGAGGLKLYAGSVPVDFIREGSVLLAVQTDGGFAPGVRETLMIVARELGRMA
jgi:hypothetical protein